MPRSPRRRASYSLIATAVAALAVLAIPQAQANHIESAGGGFGHDNTIPDGYGTSNTCNVNDGCFIAENTNIGDSSTALIGRHKGFNGGSTAPFGAGVFGDSNSQSTGAVGVYGRVASTGQPGSGSAGVRGDNGGVGNEFGDTAGVYGYNNSIGYGVRGYSAYGDGLYALTDSTIAGVAGVYGTSSAAGTYGVRGNNSAGTGVYGTGITGVSGTGTTGVYGNGSQGVKGESDSTAANVVGVQGTITSTTPGSASAGVRGQNNGTGGNGYGVYGSQAGTGFGVYGSSPRGRGVYGYASRTTGVNYGVYGRSDSATGYGGYFQGRVHVTGNLEVAGAYAQFPVRTGAPPATDCDSAAEAGRIVVRTDGSLNLYICRGATGWVGK
jgi:hypothetical protein